MNDKLLQKRGEWSEMKWSEEKETCMKFVCVSVYIYDMMGVEMCFIFTFTVFVVAVINVNYC